jgi:hypothetical protein
LDYPGWRKKSGAEKEGGGGREREDEELGERRLHFSAPEADQIK